MLSYRKKVILSDVALFIVFFALLFPFVQKAVQNVVKNSLQERGESLIDQITRQSTDEFQMVEALREQQLYVFFRVSLINAKGEVLYDSYVEDILKDEFISKYRVTHPEVSQALDKGVGYEESYSDLFSQPFAYIAIAFPFQGQKYVLRAAFPLDQIQQLTKSFEIGFLTLGGLVLLLFAASTIFILNRLSRPIQYIINSIKPYEKGFLPKIELDHVIDPNDDFGKLAHTLNSLSEKIRNQIGRLVSQKNENESILDSLIEGVIAFDTKNEMSYINQMALKILSSTKEKILGKKITCLENKEPNLIRLCESLIRDVRQNREIVIETYVKQRQQKTYYNIIAIPKEKGLGAILVFQDKTSDHKMLEMGKDFITNASHELRTPITIIKGYAEALEDLPKFTPEKVQEMIQKISRTCDRLTALVNSLLTLADVENITETRFEKVDLMATIENTIHIIESSHLNADIVIEKQGKNAYMKGDSQLIELAILNLLENSIKYGRGSPKIHIYLNQWGSEIELKIEDNGIGIPEKDLSYVFQRFFTVDKARSRKSGGVGLGLSIVKTIIEKHHGTISVDSKIGVGTTFTIGFPSYES